MELTEIRFSELDGALVAHLSGEVDMTNTEELRSSVLDRLAHTATGLVLDLGDLEYLDSAGIHLIYDLAAVLAERGQRLGLVVPAGCPAESALRYAAVLDELRACPTLTGALATLAR